MRKLPRLVAAGLAGTLLGLGATGIGLRPTAAVAQVPSLTEETARRARLDALFAALQAAGGEAEAQEVVAEIWATWSNAGLDNVDLLMQQAGAGMQSRNFGVASMLLDEVVEVAPQFAEGWNRRATLRYMMGDHAGSEADIKQVLALEPRHFGALAGRAMIHMAGERWQQALDAYRAALAVNPFLPDRHRLVPELERRLGQGRL